MKKFFYIFLLGLFITSFFALGSKSVLSAGRGYFSTQGGKLVDADNADVRITGANWGFDVYRVAEDIAHAHLDDSRVANYKVMMRAIKNAGFNTIRFVWVKEHMLPGCKFANRKNLNQELEGLTCLRVMDEVIKYAKTLDLKIILDHHTITAGLYGGIPKTTWINNWKALALRYKGDPTVIGADLNNEPSGPICWVCDGRRPEWKKAAEEGGNEILKINPNWLIFVETPNKAHDLIGVKENPIRLNVPNKLVYSVHDYYGTHYNSQDWNADFENWWGFVAKEGIAPVFVGEFQMTGEGGSQLRWMKDITTYMQKNNISGATWAWRYIPPEQSKYSFYTLTQINPDYVSMVRDERIGILRDWRVKSPVTSPPPPPPSSGSRLGDANLDNAVNFRDYDIWKRNYGKAGNWGQGSFNSDSKVDGLDYAIWLENHD